MIHSMTAFAHRTTQQDWGTAVWELRSVNHRYLDIAVRLPESLRELEPMIRDRIRQKVQRGKLEVFLKYSSPIHAGAMVNTSLVQQLALAAEQINAFFPTANTVSITDVLAWPGVLGTNLINPERLQQALLQLFDLALVDLLATRKNEGLAISQLIGGRLQQISQLIAEIKPCLPAMIDSQQKKLIAKFTDVKLMIDPQRLAQEIVMLAQKSDVAEELERLEMHLAEASKNLQQTDAVGRRLDFLMQELHREANTLAAKSADAKISALAVELRVLIEQMREQVQNVE